MSAPNPVKKPPKVGCPKVSGHQQIPAKEKKKTARVSELESQFTQLDVELMKTKDQLRSAESLKMMAQQETEDARKQVVALSATLEETKKQLKELSDSEDARVQELRKISHDRDRAWQAELEAVNKHRSIDSAALASARNEVQWFKIQLVRVSESEASHARHAELAHAEIQSLRLELAEALELVENLKTGLTDGQGYEAGAVEQDGAMETELFPEKGQGKLAERESELESELHDLKGCLLEKDTQLRIIAQENERLKCEILNWETERSIENDEALALAEVARSAEQETMLKLRVLSEEADESSRKAEMAVEELNATRASNVEMEGEMRRLKVQLDQWRKAAEVAAAMLSSENRDKCMERTALFDYNTLGGKLGALFSEDTDHDFFDKKNSNVLKKIGSLLKKGQK